MQPESKRGCISALHKSLRKGDVKKRFPLYRNLRREYTLLIMFKAIDSVERFSSKKHPSYFTFAYCLISIPLHTIFKEFKDLAFQSLCLAPNKIDFVLSCRKCILNLLSTNQSQKLEKSLICCFLFTITLLCWNTIKVSSI